MEQKQTNQKEIVKKDGAGTVVKKVAWIIFKRIFLILILATSLIAITTWDSPKTVIEVMSHSVVILFAIGTAIFATGAAIFTHGIEDIKTEISIVFLLIFFSFLTEKQTFETFSATMAIVMLALYAGVRSFFYIMFEEFKEVFKQKKKNK